MPIPDFQTLMLPLLRLLADGEEHSTKAVEESLTKTFELTPEDLEELLPSKQQTVFTNRVGWAKSHMKIAGLLEYVRKSVFKITPRGLRLLQSNPDKINVALLRQFPEYAALRVREKNPPIQPKTKDEPSIELVQTPEETISVAYNTIRKALAQELLSKIKTCSPQFFERLVVELLVKMGYGGSLQDAGEAIGKSGDEGIDGVIKEDRLGLDVIYVQAKRWEGNVGRPEIQKFVGALAGQGAKKGVFITTSRFTPDAVSYKPHETKIVLVDGNQLAELMIDFNLGVSVADAYEIKRMDTDYFESGI